MPLQVEDKKGSLPIGSGKMYCRIQSFGRHNIGALFGASICLPTITQFGSGEDYNLLVVDRQGIYRARPQRRRTVQSMGWGGRSPHCIHIRTYQL